MDFSIQTINLQQTLKSIVLISCWYKKVFTLAYINDIIFYIISMIINIDFFKDKYIITSCNKEE